MDVGVSNDLHTYGLKDVVTPKESSETRVLS